MKRLVSCFLGALLCFAMISPSAAADSKVKVYMLSGILHISAGLSALAGKLAQRGIAATVYESEHPDMVAEVIMRDYQNKQVRQIVLIGYSAGAGSAVLIAGRLNQDRTPVELLITLDPIADFTVPHNVKHAINFYVRNALVLGATNVKVNAPGFAHLSIQYLESIHEKIIDYIK
jgi:hypothetical protein